MSKTKTPLAERKAPPGGLTPFDLQVVRILAKDADDWRCDVVPGMAQPLDLLLRIQGTLDVGGDQPSTKTEKPDLELTLAIVLNELGPKTRRAVYDALLIKYASADVSKLDAEATVLAKEVVKSLTIKTPTTRAGNVVGHLIVTKIPGPKTR